MNLRATRRRIVALAVLGTLALAAACSTDQQAMHHEDQASQQTAPPPRYESRTGIPVLMDLPLVGWMFRRTTTVR